MTAAIALIESERKVDAVENPPDSASPKNNWDRLFHNSARSPRFPGYRGIRNSMQTTRTNF